MNALNKVLMVGALALTSTAANAIVVTISDNLTLQSEPSPGIQQADQGPCVIGDPSCDNTLGFTLLPVAMNPVNYLNIYSPVYKVDTFRSIVGDLFSIGVDINTAPRGGTDSHFLNAFVALINGVQVYAYTEGQALYDSSGINNNGNGFSDLRLTGFDLSGLSGDSTIQFGLDLVGVNGGRDQFFVIASPAQSVIEPGSLAILGIGLMGLGFARKTRSS